MKRKYTHDTAVSCEAVLEVVDELDDNLSEGSKHYKAFIKDFGIPQDAFDNFLSWFGQQSIEKYVRKSKQKLCENFSEK